MNRGYHLLLVNDQFIVGVLKINGPLVKAGREEILSIIGRDKGFIRNMDVASRGAPYRIDAIPVSMGQFRKNVQEVLRRMKDGDVLSDNAMLRDLFKGNMKEGYV